MPSENLQVRYTGAPARNYDADRARSPRWQAEVQAFNEIFSALAPRSVLDCPVGTGRWFDWYRGLDGPVIGLDKSEDMLEEARRKLAPGDAIQLAQADVFTHDFTRYQPLELDLVLCLRLLNWFPWEDARVILNQLTAAGSRHMLVGVTLRLGRDGTLSRLRQELKLRVRNGRASLRGHPSAHVHPEDVVLADLQAAGWSIARRTPIFHTGSGENAFFLLER